MSGFIGGGKSSASSSQYIDPTQLGFLTDLWSGAGRQVGAAQQNIQGMSGLMGQGMDFMTQLGSNDFLSALSQQAGGNEELMQRQIGDLGGYINQFAERQMGNVEQGGISAGQFGSRTSVGKGIVGEEATRAFGSGVTDIMTQDANRSLQASVAGGGLLSQGLIGGLSQMQGLMGLGMAPMMPYQGLAGIIGGPAVVGESESSAWNFKTGGGMGGSKGGGGGK